MNSSRQEEVVLSARTLAIRNHFLAWQCRERQFSIRHNEGRLSGAMWSRILIGGDSLAQIVVILNKRNSDTHTLEFRHMVLRTQDPANRYAGALKKLAEAYYQRPQEFSDCLTALFSAESKLVDQLLLVKSCALEFDFQRQYYRIPCAVENLPEHHADYQATYWHNRLFNPAMPSGVQVLSFIPVWDEAKADPLPNELVSTSHTK